jgi:hypothetical protein
MGGAGGDDSDPESPDKRPNSEGGDGGDDDQNESGNTTNFARSKLPVVQKMMRVTDRFREDSTVHPEKLYERLSDEI